MKQGSNAWHATLPSPRPTMGLEGVTVILAVLYSCFTTRREEGTATARGPLWWCAVRDWPVYGRPVDINVPPTHHILTAKWRSGSVMGS